jgi:hypothetical protein
MHGSAGRYGENVMKTSCVRGLTAAAVLLATISTRLATAVPIGPGDFGPGAIVESFEGLSPGPNIPAVGNGAFLRPGENAAYTFPSGASLTSPVPNPAVSGARVGDFTRGDASASLSGHSIVVSDIPLGSAYLIGGDETSYAPLIEFCFPTDMLRVGAYISGNHNWYTLTAYDAAGAPIETVQGRGAWSTNFLGIQDQRGIRRVDIGGFVIDLMIATRNTLVDGLTFEPLPEPSMAALFVAAAVLVHLRRPHKAPRR